jgi:hypothetical protein
MSTAAAPNTRRALTLAFGLYLVWVLATYLLEGRIHTLLRPEAIGARLSYALVANVLIGISGSALAIRLLSSASLEMPSSSVAARSFWPAPAENIRLA